MLNRYRAIRRRTPALARWRSDLVALFLATALVAVVAVMALAPEQAQQPQSSARAFPAGLAWRLESPASDGHATAAGWNQPSGLAFLQDRTFVLDTGNNRILELDETNDVGAVLDGPPGEPGALRAPIAIASDGRYLFVANSGASEIVALAPDGRPAKVIPLDKVDPADRALPRPIGLAVTADGELLVSDAENHRLMRYDQEGRLLQAIGTGERGGGETGFNTPGGLALDRAGNIYVVDALNGRVVQLSPEGAFLGQFGRLGDTAGALARPKDVAVDAAGNVYVSDGLLASVQVFGPDGTYRGFIGREDAADRNSLSLFKAPAGLTINDGTLYVVDRFAGLFAFRLPDPGP